jgi:hypothetical protein
LYGKAATGAWTLAINDNCDEVGNGFLHSATLRITFEEQVCFEEPPEPESPPTLSGKAGKGLKGPSKSGKGVKAPQLSGKGSKVEVYGVSNNQMVEPQAVPLTTIQLPSDVDEAVEDAFANMIVNIKELNVFKGNTDVFQGVRGSESNVVKVVASGEEK